MNYSRLFNISFVIWLISSFSLGCIIGYDYGKIYEQKAILERWEEIKELRRQDSIKQQVNNKAMKQKIQVTGKNIGKIFALPCVKEIRKYDYLDTTFVVHLWNAAIRHGTIFADCAFPGDCSYKMTMAFGT